MTHHHIADIVGDQMFVLVIFILQKGVGILQVFSLVILTRSKEAAAAAAATYAR